MFTEINDKYYLDEHAMTWLMADHIRDYLRAQTNEGLEELTEDIHAKGDTPFIVETFKKNWRRPRDGSNGDLHKMYRSVPDGLMRAAERELEQRAAYDYQRRVNNLINSIINPEEFPDDDEWDAIHSEEDL